ncbi:MAG: hypothetical protein M5U22_09830 [Thermoleophilia bacterium]|nr:hypothetical protein [Thermoleophilia bacterium]
MKSRKEQPTCCPCLVPMAIAELARRQAEARAQYPVTRGEIRLPRSTAQIVLEHAIFLLILNWNLALVNLSRTPDALWFPWAALISAGLLLFDVVGLAFHRRIQTVLDARRAAAPLRM